MSLLVAQSSPVEAMSSLRRHPANPHYLLFRGKPVVLVTSAAHYGMVINLDFDYLPYLETLHTYGMNLTRLFVGSFVAEAAGTPWMDSKGALSPRLQRLITPWARSTVPGYHNGGNKFDLDRWDEAYFHRLKDYVIQAGQRGIVVEVVLFSNQYQRSYWQLSPLYAANNIQGVSPVGWEQFQTLTDPALVKRQVAMVQKIVRELNAFDNIYYEISNEPYNNGVDPKTVEAWHRHIAQIILETEKTLPRQHLMAANEAIPTHPHISVVNFHYVQGISTMLDGLYSLPRVFSLDETNGPPVHANAESVRAEAWEFIIGGGGIYDGLSWHYTVNDEAARTPGNLEILQQLRVLQDFIHSFDFVRMHPDRSIIISGVPQDAYARVLVETAKQYALYLHHSTYKRDKDFVTGYIPTPGQYQVDLTLNIARGRFRAEWIEPASGKVMQMEQFTHDGGNKVLSSPPYTVDVALRITRERAEQP